MDNIAAKRPVDRPVEIVLRAKAKHPLGIDAVGIGNPVIDLGGGKAARPRGHRRGGARPRRGCHRRHRQQRQHLVTPDLPAVNRARDAERLCHRVKPLSPAAWCGRGIAVTKRAGQDHLWRADGHPDIMRAQTRSPVVRLQTGGLPHLGVGPGIDVRARRPVALVEPAKDQPVGTLHACLDRAEDGQSWMCLPGPAHRPAGKKLRKNLREGVMIRLEPFPLLGK